MASRPLRAIGWIVVGMLLMGAIVWFTMPALMVIQHKSPRDYQATVTALQPRPVGGHFRDGGAR